MAWIFNGCRRGIRFFREGESDVSSVNSEQAPETSLWERLGSAAALDIESVDFPWVALSSLHHTEHTSSAEQSEDEMNRALEVPPPEILMT